MLTKRGSPGGVPMPCYRWSSFARRPGVCPSAGGRRTRSRAGTDDATRSGALLGGSVELVKSIKERVAKWLPPTPANGLRTAASVDEGGRPDGDALRVGLGRCRFLRSLA